MGDSELDELLDELWNVDGTDLLLTVGSAPHVRVDGELRLVDGYLPLTPEDTAAIVASLLTEQQREKFANGQDVDFSFSWREDARIRGNAFRQRNTVAVALRMIPRTIPTFDELGLPEAVRRFANLKQGLVFVTGPTGSGKSTTLASIIDWISANRSVHVLTIEDPIEYVRLL